MYKSVRKKKIEKLNILENIEFRYRGFFKWKIWVWIYIISAMKRKFDLDIQQTKTSLYV